MSILGRSDLSFVCDGLLLQIHCVQGTDNPKMGPRSNGSANSNG